MAPIYLLDIYKIIDTQLAKLRELQSSASQVDVESSWLLEGRVDALTDVRDFLKRGYEGKLPKRLQAKNTPLGN